MFRLICVSEPRDRPTIVLEKTHATAALVDVIIISYTLAFFLIAKRSYDVFGYDSGATAYSGTINHQIRAMYSEITDWLVESADMAVLLRECSTGEARRCPRVVTEHIIGSLRD